MIQSTDEKMKITDQILHNLPQWFGNEDALLVYVEGVKDKPLFAAYYNDELAGFISLKINNAYTAEIYVMGLFEKYFRLGIGKELLYKSEQYLRENNYRFLMVKTLADSCDYEPYKRTRTFYSSVGFYPLDELIEIWDKDNPCLIMIKNI